MDQSYPGQRGQGHHCRPLAALGGADVTDVKFYIDGNRVNANGSVSFAATARWQPVVQAYKASGTGVATVTCDFLRLCSGR